MNKVVKRAQQFTHFGPSYPRIELETLHRVVLSDPSLATDEDSWSQMGLICVLMGGSATGCVVSIASRKSKHVVFLVLSAQLFAFAERCGQGIATQPQPLVYSEGRGASEGAD